MSKRNKKEIVEGEKKKGNGTVVAVIMALVIIAVAGFVVLGGGPSTGFQTVTAEAGVLKIPVTDVSDSKAHYYTYKVNGKNVNFFVLKSSDGIIRAAFDACDVCFREKKGYRQEGDNMVCNNCGQRFPSIKINEIKGGCNPAPIDRKIVDGNLIINVVDIENGNGYF